MPTKNRSIPTSVAELVESGRGAYNWFGRLRLKAFSVVLGIALATAAVIMWTPVGWIPAVGVATVATVVTISRIAQKLTKPVCYSCAKDLSDQPDGEHGIVCPSCGALHQGRRMALGRTIDPRVDALIDDPAADAVAQDNRPSENA